MRISDWSSDVCSSDLAGATLFRSDGTTQQARTADALVAQVLGSPIPVEGLRDWLRGRTGSQRVDDLKKNAAGQIESFVQNGWSVRLSNYDARGPRLLRKIGRASCRERVCQYV